jgi:hypothetical protein
MKPMDRRSNGKPDADAHERLKRPADDASGVSPVLVIRTSNLRSPIVEDRTIELLAPDPDRPSVEVPPIRELIRPLAWAIVPAVPSLVLAGWQAALIAAGVGVLLQQLSERAGRSTFVLTDGFLRFRGDDARAQGVQEEDDVRWAWTSGAVTGGREDDARPSWPESISP